MVWHTPCLHAGDIDKQLSIKIVLADRADMHLRLANSIQLGLNKISGYALTLETINADAGALDAQQLANADLIIPVGTRATQLVLQSNANTVTFSVLIPKITLDELTTRYPHIPLTGIYLDQPAQRFMALCRGIVPEGNRVGILWGPTSVKQSTEFISAAENAELSLITELLEKDGNPIKLIEKLLASSDVLLARYDSLALDPATAKWLLFMAYRERVPVIGFSRSYVDAGALAAIYSSPEHFARQTLETVGSILDHGRIGHVKPAYPQYFDIGLNASVARSIGIKLPDEAELMRQLLESHADGVDK